jgi:cell fate regulator YaaT (PSP1 superfamily)
MASIIGVKFRSRGKLVYCDTGEMSVQVNDYVVVDTDHGQEVARVVTL